MLNAEATIAWRNFSNFRALVEKEATTAGGTPHLAGQTARRARPRRAPPPGSLARPPPEGDAKPPTRPGDDQKSESADPCAEARAPGRPSRPIGPPCLRRACLTRSNGGQEFALGAARCASFA